MKSKKPLFITVAVILCLALCAGAVYVCENIFPKAEEIPFPEVSEIISATVSTDEGTAKENIDSAEILTYIAKAKPTRKQSVNDFPDTRPYYIFTVVDNERTYYYFIYEENNQVYAELPYEGIYKADSKLFDIISSYF